MKMGEQKRIPLPANQQKKRCHVFGAYNWINDHIEWMIAQWKNSETFITFLEYLLVEKVPNRSPRLGFGSCFLPQKCCYAGSLEPL